MPPIDPKAVAYREGYGSFDEFRRSDPERAQALLGSMTVEPIIDSPTLNKVADEKKEE
jgi:hypothetical protein